MNDAEKIVKLEPFRELAKRYREREATCRELRIEHEVAVSIADGMQEKLQAEVNLARVRAKAATWDTAANDLEQLISQLDKPTSGEGRRG